MLAFSQVTEGNGAGRGTSFAVHQRALHVEARGAALTADGTTRRIDLRVQLLQFWHEMHPARIHSPSFDQSLGGPPQIATRAVCRRGLFQEVGIRLQRAPAFERRQSVPQVNP